MTTNVKIQTEDVLEILDTKIKTASAHAQLAVTTGEYYDSVLAKIAARSPTLNEKGALTAAYQPGVTTALFTFLPTDVNTTANTIATTTLLLEGDAGKFSSTGQLPSGLDTSTTFFARNPTATEFQVSKTQFGTIVPLGDQGTGIHTYNQINRYVTLSELTTSLAGRLPWKTIGLTGSGADYQGNDETPFIEAFNSGEKWFYVKAGVYTFTNTLTVPKDVRLIGGLITTTMLVSDAEAVLKLNDNAYVGFLTVISTAIDGIAVDASSTVGVYLNNCMLASASTASTLETTDADSLTLTECAFVFGNVTGSNLANAIVCNVYVDAAGTNGFNLSSPNNLIMWGSTFYAGTPQITSGVNVRIVGNHFNDSLNMTGDIVRRANTPSSNNNEDESLTNLLQYLGSLSTVQSNPAYSSNFAGNQGQDLTARASALDLLLQWIYEERNFSLIASTEPMVVSWTPSQVSPYNGTLTTTGEMQIVSGHRSPLVWKLAAINTLTIPNGSFLYYILNRDMTTSQTLTPHVIPMGSFPNLDTNAPTGSPDNRQIWVLAYNLNGTLWWRGGNGSRFPKSGYGEYFVDGSSKSLLTYLGSTDYNDSDPNYISNFVGVQGESLTTRLGKTDTMIKRLFEYSNLGYYLSAGDFLYTESNTLSLAGTLYFSLPHTQYKISITQSALIPLGSLTDGQLIYLTWNQVALLTANQTATATKSTTVPLPDAYPLTTKYFVMAMRVGSEIILWDGTKLPIAGGRWPLPTGRSVIKTASATILSNNTVWDGTNLLWEKLAVAVSTGASLTRNTIADQTTISAGLTTLADGTGIVVTHTWNQAGGTAQNATLEKKSLPLTSALAQNQFLWAFNRGGYLFFTDDN